MRMLSVGYLAEDCSSLVDSGAPTRTRTADLLITNQLLYQLSYRGTSGAIMAKILSMQALAVCFCQKNYSTKGKHHHHKGSWRGSIEIFKARLTINMGGERVKIKWSQQ